MDDGGRRFVFDLQGSGGFTMSIYAGEGILQHRKAGNWFKLEMRGGGLFSWSVFSADNEKVAGGIADSLETAKGVAQPYLGDMIIEGLTAAQEATDWKQRLRDYTPPDGANDGV